VLWAKEPTPNTITDGALPGKLADFRVVVELCWFLPITAIPSLVSIISNNHIYFFRFQSGQAIQRAKGMR
jgi:hypothetical protein